MADGAWPEMRAWPTRKVTKLITSPATSATPVQTTALAASRRLRFGTAARLVRIMPVEYSPVTTMTPRMAKASWAMARLRQAAIRGIPAEVH